MNCVNNDAKHLMKSFVLNKLYILQGSDWKTKMKTVTVSAKHTYYRRIEMK